MKTATLQLLFNTTVFWHMGSFHLDANIQATTTTSGYVKHYLWSLT